MMSQNNYTFYLYSQKGMMTLIYTYGVNKVYYFQKQILATYQSANTEISTYLNFVTFSECNTTFYRVDFVFNLPVLPDVSSVRSGPDPTQSNRNLTNIEDYSRNL